jgi:hypothetical protein
MGMDESSYLRVIALAVLAIFLAAVCGFFTYYTARLAWVNLTAADISAHRQAGMYTGAVAFPIAAAGFGWLALLCARAALRAARPEKTR